jgi:tetratricopeptide (TPR) repeat protein
MLLYVRNTGVFSMTILMKRRLSSLLMLLALALSQSSGLLRAQSNDPVRDEPDPTWAGRRIVMLKGFGDYFVSAESGQAQLIKGEGLSVNIVAVVQRVEGNRVWIKGNGFGDAGIGWIEKQDVVALEDAIPYFTSQINHDSNDWDAYLRRAESEHALNRREAAIADYIAAIRLRPDEPFLYLRRGRSYRILKSCDKAAADYEEVIRLKPAWAEAYNLEASIYADCPDPQFRNQQKAVRLIEHAIALDGGHPTYLTVLALAYFRLGQLGKAVTTQKQALESPQFPPSYREEAANQLHEYERALDAQKGMQH